MTDRRSEPRWGFTASARLRIIGWMMLLTVLGLVAAGTAVLVIESGRIDHRADRNIVQEFDELDRLVAASGSEYNTPEDLFEDAMSRNVAQQYEIYVGLVENDVRYVSYGPGGTASADLANDGDFVGAITSFGRAGGFGSVETARGEVRFGVRPVVQEGVRATYVVAYLTSPWRGEFVSVMRGYGLAALLTVLIVALGGWVVAGRILRPVHDLEVTARDITESDITARIATDEMHSDVSRLARTFNTMLDRLASAFESQRQFLDDAGHELATPITIVRGHLELLDARDPAEVEETRALLLDELDRMHRLTRDLVLLAKSERPDFVHRRDLDVGPLTDDLLRLASALGDRAWQLDARAEGTVAADPQRLVQAMLQLAVNAVRYTRPGDEVGIGTVIEAGELRLWVRDTGPGVAPEERERIFQRFSRGAAASGTEGSGLGLSIVVAIAKAHGGLVELGPPPGARFIITIPDVTIDSTVEGDRIEETQ